MFQLFLNAGHSLPNREIPAAQEGSSQAVGCENKEGQWLCSTTGLSNPRILFVMQRDHWINVGGTARWEIARKSGHSDHDHH